MPSNRPPSLQNQQLLPALVIRKEDLHDPEKAAALLRLIYSTVGTAFERAMKLVDDDPRMKNYRQADFLYGMAHDIRIIDRAKGLPGDVLTLVDQYNCVFASTASPGPGGVVPAAAAHDILSATHTDSLASAVSRGSLIVGNSTPKWAELNIGAANRVLASDGTDAAWTAITAAMLPVIAAAGGWTDDGTIVRLTTSTDQVGIGTATPGALLGLLNVNAVGDIMLLLTGKASQTGDLIRARDSALVNRMRLIGTATETQLFLHAPAGGRTRIRFDGPTTDQQYIDFGESSDFGPPLGTTTGISCPGTRFNTYVTTDPQFCDAYGQDSASCWVLIDVASDYIIVTGDTTSASRTRAQWTPNGDLSNFGRIRSRKFTVGTTGLAAGTPAIELEETGAGTNYTGFKAPAAITSDHLYTLPSGFPAAASLWSISSGGVISAVTQVATRRKWLDAKVWESGSGGGLAIFGTPPNSYISQNFLDAVDSYINACVEVPDDWTSGVVTVKCHWTSSGAAAQNWVPHFYYLERVDGDSMTAAGTHITGPTTSANFATDILKITTIGTFTPGAAGRLLRLTMARLATSDANDNYTNTINLVGVELSYTPVY